MSLIKFLLAPTKALNLYMVKKISFYLKFLFQGTNKYNIHSPLVHDMIENILDNSIKYYSFVGIEHVRSLLLKQTSPCFHDLVFLLLIFFIVISTMITAWHIFHVGTIIVII